MKVRKLTHHLLSNYYCNFSASSLLSNSVHQLLALTNSPESPLIGAYNMMSINGGRKETSEAPLKVLKVILIYKTLQYKLY